MGVQLALANRAGNDEMKRWKLFMKLEEGALERGGGKCSCLRRGLFHSEIALE